MKTKYIQYFSISFFCILNFITSAQNRSVTQLNMSPHPASEEAGMPANRACGSHAPSEEWENAFQEKINQFIAQQGVSKTNAALTIPVIIHVIHSGSSLGVGTNISNAQAVSQIPVLNADFAGTGLNVGNVPSVWANLVANTGISFCLATKDEQGNTLSEPGVDRKSYSALGITTPSNGFDPTYVDQTIKPITIWDPTKYFNCWVLDLDNTLLGYATFPPLSNLSGLSQPYGTTSDDGIVIDYRAWGNTGNVGAPYNKGRTASHEAGHWLGLRHIWGDTQCGNDFCSDTPTAQSQNSGCPTFPFAVNSCSSNSNGEMFMNFMDYCNDVCTFMFTLDQKTRMLTALANSPLRQPLTSSNACGGGSGGNSTCDTIVQFTGTNLSIYNSGTWGYLSGHNSYGDIAKADRFTLSNFLSPNSNGYKATGVILGVARASGAGFMSVKIWNESNSLPGTVLASQNIFYNSLTPLNYNVVNFTNPITISNINTNYYYGISYTYAPGDTIALYTQGTGLSGAAQNRSYEQWSDNAWHSFYDAYNNTPYIQAIVPVICPITTGLEEEMGMYQEVVLFPNPATDQINIAFNYDTPTNASIIMFNTLGEVVVQMEKNNILADLVNLNTSALPIGTYFVNIKTDKGITTRKMILTK